MSAFSNLTDSALSNLIVGVSLAAAAFGLLLNFIGLCAAQASISGGGFNIFGLSWYFMFLYLVWLVVSCFNMVTREMESLPFKKLASGLTLLVLAGAPLDIGDSLSSVSVDIGSIGNQLKTAGTIILVLAAFVLFFNDNVNIKDLKSILNSRSQKQSDPAVAVIQKEMVPREVQDVESGMIVPPPHSVASSDGEGAKLGQPKNAIAEPVVETFLAQALYNYDANPADKKEISFKAGEVFEVTDARGKWWKVRGTTSNNVGIAPSNFLKVLSQ